MSFFDVIVLYLVIWWPVFFITLPFGNKPLNKEENKEVFAPSAPAKPRVFFKFVIACIITLLITILLYLISYFKLFSFKSFIIG